MKPPLLAWTALIVVVTSGCTGDGTPADPSAPTPPPEPTTDSPVDVDTTVSPAGSALVFQTTRALGNFSIRTNVTAIGATTCTFHTNVTGQIKGHAPQILSVLRRQAGVLAGGGANGVPVQIHAMDAVDTRRSAHDGQWWSWTGTHSATSLKPGEMLVLDVVANNVALPPPGANVLGPAGRNHSFSQLLACDGEIDRTVHAGSGAFLFRPQSMDGGVGASASPGIASGVEPALTLRGKFAAAFPQQLVSLLVIRKEPADAVGRVEVRGPAGEWRWESPTYEPAAYERAGPGGRYELDVTLAATDGVWGVLAGMDPVSGRE